jgi:hypothetical protein
MKPSSCFRFLVYAWLMGVAMNAQTQPPPRTVDKGDFSNVDEARQVVVRTDAEWRTLWRKHAGERSMPSVDFSKETVVGVFMGSRPTAGYDIAITKTLEKDGTLWVFYRERTPARGLVLAQVLTFPFHLVAVPKTAGEVKFEKTESGGK